MVIVGDPLKAPKEATNFNLIVYFMVTVIVQHCVYTVTKHNGQYKSVSAYFISAFNSKLLHP